MYGNNPIPKKELIKITKASPELLDNLYVDIEEMLRTDNFTLTAHVLPKLKNVLMRINITTIEHLNSDILKAILAYKEEKEFHDIRICRSNGIMITFYNDR